MTPVHTLHIYQPNDRFRHRRNLRQLPQVLSRAADYRHRPLELLAIPVAPHSRSAADCWQPAIPVGATRGTRVAMRPVHTLHIYQPNDRFRHRRNLRQLPQVLWRAADWRHRLVAVVCKKSVASPDTVACKNQWHRLLLSLAIPVGPPRVHVQPQTAGNPRSLWEQPEARGSR